MKDKNGVVDTTITPRAGPFRVGRGSGGEPFSIEAATRTIALVKTDGTHTEGNANLLAASSDLLSACRIGIKQGHEGNLLIPGNWWINSCGEYWKILHVVWPTVRSNCTIFPDMILLAVATPRGIIGMRADDFTDLLQTADANGNYPVLRT